MDEKLNKKYCFTDQEFLILAGSLGIKSLYGFKPTEPVRKQEREVYQQLFKMTKKGFLEAVEDGYLVVPDIRELFRYMKDSRSVISVCAADDSFPEKCIYTGDNAVLVEPGGLQGRYFKCSYDLPDQICDQLCENGVVFSQNIADDMLYDASPMSLELAENEELVKISTGLEDLGDTQKRRELKKCGVHTIIDKKSVCEDSVQKRLLLVERPVYDIILVQSEERVEIFRYSRRLLLEVLQQWMEEDDIE